MPFSLFSTNRQHYSRTRRDTAPRKSAFDSSSIVFLRWCRQIWPKVNSLPPVSKHFKSSCFYEKGLSILTFDSVNTRHSFCQHRLSFVGMRRMKHNLILKDHVENWPKVKVITWLEKVMLHISWSVSSSWTYRTYLWCFHSLVCLYQSWLPKKTAGDLSWPISDLAKWPLRY